jgi:hypothetical protein
MTISSIRTLVTSKAAISLATVALLGGGAALAAPGEVVPLDDDPVELPEPDDDSVLPEQQGLDVADEVRAPGQDIAAFCEEEPEAAFCRGPSEQNTDDDAVDETTEDAVEDDGPGWALGRQDDGQQDRVEAFCEARIAAAEANGSNGVPPFCTAGENDSPIAPNALGQRMAEAARGGELGEEDGDGAGPPPGAGRPGGASDDASSDDIEVERSGPPVGARGGPPAGVPGRGRG